MLRKPVTLLRQKCVWHTWEMGCWFSLEDAQWSRERFLREERLHDSMDTGQNHVFHFKQDRQSQVLNRQYVIIWIIKWSFWLPNSQWSDGILVHIPLPVALWLSSIMLKDRIATYLSPSLPGSMHTHKTEIFKILERIEISSDSKPLITV